MGSVKPKMIRVRLRPCPICGGKEQFYIWKSPDEANAGSPWVEVKEVERNLHAGNCKIECATCNCFFGTNNPWVRNASDLIRFFNTRGGNVSRCQ